MFRLIEPSFFFGLIINDKNKFYSRKYCKASIIIFVEKAILKFVHSNKINPMKYLVTCFLFSIITISSFAQDKELKKAAPDKNKPVITVEASCGQCQLGLPGKSCDLAVRINGKAYFVDGVHIDSLGDAHANDGFCNAIRKAKVQGEIVDNRFKASYFHLLPEAMKKAKKD